MSETKNAPIDMLITMMQAELDRLKDEYTSNRQVLARAFNNPDGPDWVTHSAENEWRELRAKIMQQEQTLSAAKQLAIMAKEATS